MKMEKDEHKSPSIFSGFYPENFISEHRKKWEKVSKMSIFWICMARICQNPGKGKEAAAESDRMPGWFLRRMKKEGML